jgi:hypothetical protein
MNRKHKRAGMGIRMGNDTIFCCEAGKEFRRNGRDGAHPLTMGDPKGSWISRMGIIRLVNH